MAAGFDAMSTSPIFWTKTALVALLVVNGAAMHHAERAAHHRPAAAWPRLHPAAVVSLVLWFAIVLVGTILTLEAQQISCATRKISRSRRAP